METTEPRPIGRRALLATAASCATGLAAAALAAPSAVIAGDNDPVLVGKMNEGSSTTYITSTGTHTLDATAAAGDGLRGHGGSGAGSGVFGATGSATGYGVYGYNGPNMGRAALGAPDAAVWALQMDAPLALYAGGDSLFTGKVSLSRSGRASVRAGASSVVVTVGVLSGTPLCFAMLQRNRTGVWVRAVRPNHPAAGKMQIFLSKAVPASTSVAWVVLG
jgi:hypothetical protein